MSDSIPSIFSDRSLISDSFVKSNDLFLDIIGKFSIDHDVNNLLQGTGLHKKVTLVATAEPPEPVGTQAILYRENPLELTLAELDSEKKISRKSIAGTLPALPVAYASFSLSGGVKSFAFGENIQDGGIVVLDGQAKFNIGFTTPLSSASYKISGWGISPDSNLVYAYTRNETVDGFQFELRGRNNEALRNLSIINVTIFF